MLPISQPLSILFLKSLIEGIVPLQWLKASITDIHKKGAKNVFENHRPDIITSIVCKLMVSITRDKVVGYMVSNHFNYLKNCMTNLLLIMEDWTNYIEEGHPIATTVVGGFWTTILRRFCQG